jgi:hypothetical protein
LILKVHEKVSQHIQAREICEIGHQIRKANNQKVRTPLLNLNIKIDKDVSKIKNNIWEVVLTELNIKNIVINDSFRYPEKEVFVTEKDLEKEGRLRDLIREVQAIRKNLGLLVSDNIRLKAPKEDVVLLEGLKKKLRITEIIEGDKIEVAD